MSNRSSWCSNQFEITGDPQAIQEFKAAVSDLELIPMPTGLQLAENAATACADWRDANWGVETDTNAELTVSEPTFLLYEFGTPYRPPLKWLRTVAKRYPLLRFTLRYEVESTDEGSATFENGEQQDDEG